MAVLWYSGGVDWARRPPSEYDRAVNWVTEKIATMTDLSKDEVINYAEKSIHTLDYLMQFSEINHCLPILLEECVEWKGDKRE